MKVLIGAVAATMVLCATAAAQETTTPAPAVQAPPSRCGELPPQPEMRDGSDASAPSMEAALAEFEAWDQASRAVLVCRRDEAEEIQAISETRRAEYNAGVTSMNTAIAAWRAEVEEYNARSRRRRR